MFVNYAAQGVKQQGKPDIVTVKQYHPEVMASFFLLCKKMNMGWDGLFADNCPDMIISGYRGHDPDPAVKHSPHGFAIALDIHVSNFDAHIPSNQPVVLDAQIKWITAATESGLFTRGGFYPQQNTIHLDIADPAWMETYNGSRFWVKWGGVYAGFQILDNAIAYAKQKIMVAANV